MQQELDFLYSRINYERELNPGNEEFRFQSLIQLLAKLDNPHEKIRTVHVAGTKGKGSVCKMIGNAIAASGCRVGVYMSPHVESIRERFIINDRLITEDELAEELAQVRSAVLEVDDALTAEPDSRPLTFFEICTAMAMNFFFHRSVDWMVLEVGMGGRLDSTNICQPSVCVITNISFDHMRQLGSTLARIAAEKAGIVKTGIPVVCGVLDQEARNVIHEIAGTRQALLYQLNEHFSFDTTDDDSITVVGQMPNERQGVGKTPTMFSISGIRPSLIGKHQQQNACVATVALKILSTFDEKITDSAIRNGIASAKLSGRLEVFDFPLMRLVVDMAHNTASVEALVAALPKLISARQGCARKTLIFACSQDKRADEMLALLVPHFDMIILTQYANNPRGRKAEQLQQIVQAILTESADECRSPQVVIAANPSSSWDMVVESLNFDEGQSQFVCVAGSAFLCAEIRPLIKSQDDSLRPSPIISPRK
ncbi:MAG TPA: Mur ligase family protein [Pirellulaceae bacterium]|nr:Mur ligase family protein [Pirellulaceae bacterium]HMO91662.1 Mur ligase family protein [Pirellulaceae bacterium]HMP68359.1 Mur ligase family protein [Pirellulaceae bacterium]